MPLGAKRHGLHVYHDDADAGRYAAGFAVQNLRAGRPVILVPSLAHRDGMFEALRRHGAKVAELQAAGLLVVGDADECAAKCMSHPSGLDDVWAGFQASLAALRAKGFSTVAVWGETPDLLLKAGRLDLFRDLELRWAIETEKPGIVLKCSYRADLLDPDIYGGELLGVCALHTHVAQTDVPATFDAAVDAAFTKVLGPRDLGMAYSLAASDSPLPTGLPAAAHRLRWVRHNMPATYKKVFEAARA
ncbi:MAG: MEDS domain-containing protein [Elusimicrobiota bacterium]|nr:MAG: MEDS domain-containing protein [Elusimicrobiota bacterium]